MTGVFGAIFGRLSLQSVITDSAFFWLNYRITVIILVALAWLMIVQEIFQDPIECIFADYSEVYINRYCSLQSFFTLRRKVTLLMEDGFSVEDSAVQADLSLTMINYYQIGFITLLLRAVLFYIPRYLWNLMEGGKMKMLATELITSNGGKDCSEKNNQPLIFYFRKHFHGHDNYAYHYMFCESLNLFNLGVQLQLSRIFIDNRFGIFDIYPILAGQPTSVTDTSGQLLSITTECTLAGPFDGPGNPGNITGTCLLSPNSVNEQIQASLFFWTYFLAVYGIFVILYRFATCLFSSVRWLKFRLSCSIIPDKTIAVAYNRLKIGDWFVLLMLRKNIDVLHYEELILDIAANDESCV
ncbi:viral innexin-b5.1 [Ichnoviriform fugitivi]|uniref:Viral innexin-b5.1 n=1 Tax=Ichnoviriform fugitivi TaxID=265522 RepID=A2Q0D9_9VIRU|nr:viral innexin-b5.1 [Ichnoviriform fugitivi]BAF45654.1 viral innexin-b5.1 [Ichnoviriform fugitivi]